jgi:hypothetical protein
VSDAEIQLFLAEKSLLLMLLFMSHSLIGVNSIIQKLQTGLKSLKPFQLLLFLTEWPAN